MELPNQTNLRKHLLARQEQGFALIITLVMMALLIVISLAMLSLASIVTRSATHGDAQSNAEDNARMALMIALGQLQAHAGSDERITATADIAGRADGSALANETAPENDESLDGTSKGLSPVAPGTRYWTGVWQNRDPVESIYIKTPAPELVQWLVSGNEHMPKTVTPASPEYALNPDGSVVDPEKSVVLVGSNTVGNMTPEATTHVAAPLVEIADQNGTRTGRYAWWVGDEGVKARGNLPSSGDPNLPATNLTLGERGGGWETVSGLERFPARGAPDEPTLSRVFTFPSISLVEPSLRTAAPQYFHGLTVESRGLFTNTLAGGLRVDLTPYLENGFSENAATGPVSGENILPYWIAPDIKGPTWDRLRGLRTMKPATEDVLMVSAGNGKDEAIISPMIFDMRLLLGAQLTSQSASQYRISPTGKIAVVLANPYPYPLRWDNLELELVLNSGTSNPIGIWVGNSAMNPGVGPYYIARPDRASVFGNVTLSIPADELPPGGTQVYAITDRHVRPFSSDRVTIPLARPQPTDLMDISKSIVMPYSVSHSTTRRIHVREQTATCRISVILRTAGSSSGSTGILHRINTFELDSARWGPGERDVSASLAQRLTVPFPLVSFSFQMSQPGMNYQNILPATWQLGVRNSTLRTFMDFNVRAQHYPRPIASYNSPPYFFEQHNNRALLPMPNEDPEDGDIPPTGTAFTRNLAISPLRWGHSSVTGPNRTILFDVPDEIVSLAQFQHVDLTSDNNFPSVASQPAYAVGNSYASPLLKRGLSTETRYDYNLISTFSASAAPNMYYDMSYLLNAALWDSCFLSTLHTSESAAELAKPLNPRITVIRPGDTPDTLHDPLRAATRLYLEGSFNVNSTRKDAWKALLASNRKLKHPADAAIPAEGAMFPRSLSQTSQARLPKPSGDDDDSFNGFRRLSDAELDALAEEITRQVRLRGPFVSLSHFVNRALVDLGDDEDHLGRSGALQSAIDNSGLNMVPRSNASGFENLTPANNLVRMRIRSNGTPEADWVGTRGTDSNVRNHPADTGPPVWASHSADANPGNTGSMLSDREMLASPTYSPEQGFRSTGIPGWLTQADVLQAIGPVISARSDTFRIRSYGESLDAAGNVIARAWCEAIVQRTPDYVDPTNPPEADYDSLNSVNLSFGRRFEIISFRWLHPDEI